MEMSLVIAEQSDEEQLCGCVRVQRSSDQEVREGESICCFRPLQGQRREGRRHHIIAEVDVHDSREDAVERRCKHLERPRGLFGVLGSLHFGDEDEEHEVASVGEDRTGDREECVWFCCQPVRVSDGRTRTVERGRRGDFDGLGAFERSGCCHAYQPRDEDADTGEN